LGAETQPDGLRLVFQPAYTPEVQPAETLWTLVDEPVVNKHIPTLEALDEIISMRCAALATDREKIKSQAGFHWWPKIANPKVISRKPYHRACDRRSGSQRARVGRCTLTKSPASLARPGESFLSRARPRVIEKRQSDLIGSILKPIQAVRPHGARFAARESKMPKPAIPHDAFVFVGDGRKALFLCNAGDEKFANFVTERVFVDEENPSTHEQGTDRPGRGFASAGSTRRSAMEPTDWHEIEEHRFVQRASEALERLVRERAAPPSMHD